MKPYNYNPTAKTDHLPIIGFQIKEVAAPPKDGSPFRRIAPGRRIHTEVADKLGNLLRSIFGIHTQSHTYQNHRKINDALKNDRDKFPSFYH